MATRVTPWGVEAPEAPFLKGFGDMRSQIQAPAVVLLVVALAPTAAGQLDPAFGIAGQVTTDVLGPSDDDARSVAIQDDAKIIVAGHARAMDGPFSFGPPDFVLARYHPDGSLDAGFGLAGRVRADFDASSDRATDVAIQDDGKIVVAGSASIPPGPGFVPTPGFGLVRFEADGDPDKTFGEGGKVVFSLGANMNFRPMDPAVAIQDDGKIVVAGTLGEFAPDFRDFIAIVRFEPNGSVDVTFSVDGLVTTNTGRRDTVHDLVIRPDGRILVVGSSNETDFTDSDFRLACYLPDGSLDPSFGIAGIVVTDFATQDDVAEAMVLLPDGRIVVAGSSGGDFALARYNADGSLDGAFGAAGQVVTDLGSDDDSAGGVDLAAGGRIVVAGSSGGDFALAVYLPNGSLDSSFGDAGIETTDLSADTDDGRDVALHADGRIVVVGTAPGTGGADFAVSRYLPNGGLDPGFGAGGFVLTDVLGSTDNPAYDVALQANGKIVVAGAVGDALALARYNADGGLDETFGDGGVVVTAISAGPEPSLALRVDGDIVAAGVLGDAFAVVRHFPDGTPDMSFGSGGVATTDFPSLEARARDVAIQADGKIVVTGDTISCNEIFCTHAFALARYHPDGSPDVGFGDGGSVLTFGRAGQALAIQPDGKIVVAGSTAFLVALPRGIGITLVRYEPDGSLDLSFGDDAIVTTNFPMGSGFGESVAIQADGKIVVAGRGTGPAGTDFALVRYQPDGGLDAEFGTSGVVLTDHGSPNDQIHSMAIQPDGRIVVAGLFGDSFNHDEDDFVVAVYESSGSLDTGFGTNGTVTSDFGADDEASGIALQSDGKIVVVGRTQRRSRADFALARYESALREDPTVQLRINGQHPPSNIVETDGPIQLRLDIVPGNGTRTLAWFFIVTIEQQMFFVTPDGGCTTNMEPLVISPPLPLQNVLLVDAEFPPGTEFTFGFFLVGEDIIASDVISAVVRSDT